MEPSGKKFHINFLSFTLFIYTFAIFVQFFFFPIILAPISSCLLLFAASFHYIILLLMANCVLFLFYFWPDRMATQIFFPLAWNHRFLSCYHWIFHFLVFFLLLIFCFVSLCVHFHWIVLFYYYCLSPKHRTKPNQANQILLLRRSCLHFLPFSSIFLP